MKKIKKLICRGTALFMLFLMLFSTSVMAADKDLTWDGSYEKTGYHLEKFGEARKCSHRADKCAYIVSKCTGLYPTKKELLNSVYSSSSKLKILDKEVVSANGTPGTGGSVSPYALNVTVDNVNFKELTCQVASPYADANTGITGYNYIYWKFSWCAKTSTWYFVGQEHYWLGTVDGGVGTNEVHNTTYTHYPQRYQIVPNEYAIKFDGNGATSGSTAKMTNLEYNQTYTLTANGFKRTGYTFTGWNTKEDGSGTAYKNKASVKNLTSKDGGTVTLYAQWTANEYGIKFDGNGATSGSTAKMTGLKYDKSYNLTANGFKRTGYTFTGWNTKEDGSGTAYKNKASVKNLTSKDGGTVTLYAQWTANTATIQYNSNGGTINNSPYYNQNGNVYYKLTSGMVYVSSSANGTYMVKTSSLKYNATSMNLVNVGSFGISRTGYELVDGAEWIVGSASSGITVTQDNVTDASEIAKVTSAIKNGSGTVILYANWKPCIYKITLDNQSADSSGTTEYYEKYNVGNFAASDCKNEIAQITIPTKTGYVFGGYYTEKNGKGIQYVKADGTITSTKTTFTKDTTLYAKWNTGDDVNYTVNHWLRNVDGIEDNLDSDNYTLQETDTLSGTTGEEVVIAELARTYTGFTYKAGQVQGNTVEKTNILADGSLVVDLYYARNTYKLTINPNGGEWSGSSENSEIELCYQEEITIDYPVREGYEFSGWTLQGEESTLDDITGDNLTGKTFKMGCEDATMMANWEAHKYIIHFDGNGGSGEMDDIEATYDQEVILPENVFVQEAYKYMGWQRNIDLTYGTGYVIEFEDCSTVKNLTSENNAVVTLYAVWDKESVIDAHDLYYSLEEAQNTTDTEGITLDEIISHATATDDEDGILPPGKDVQHEDGKVTTFTIIDYSKGDFTQFQHEGSVTETFRAIDSVGNVVEKQITVHIVDTSVTEVKPTGTVRFIDEKYYAESYENGGLEDNSIWKINPDYSAALNEAFVNLKEGTPEKTYTFTRAQIKKIQEFVKENGIGNSRSADSLSRFAEEFLQ